MLLELTYISNYTPLKLAWHQKQMVPKMIENYWLWPLLRSMWKFHDLLKISKINIGHR